MSDNKFPLISVIVPIYNVSQYLDRCIKSILSQSYQNLNIVLVDDGSTDGSGELCDKYACEDSRIQVIHKSYGGVSDARNAGIRAAIGEYFCFVDSDDYVTDDYVSYLYDLIEQYECRISICGTIVVLGNGKTLGTDSCKTEVITSRECIERIFYDEGITVSTWGKMYQRNLFDGVEFPVGKLFEDAAITYKPILKCERVAVGAGAKYFYAIRHNSIVTSSFNPSKIDLIEMSDLMCDAAEQRWPDIAQASLRRRVYVRFSTLNQMLNTDECPDKKAEMIAYVKQHRKAILSDKRAPRRDKFALCAIAFGFKAYKLLWGLYIKVFK